MPLESRCFKIMDKWLKSFKAKSKNDEATSNNDSRSPLFSNSTESNVNTFDLSVYAPSISSISSNNASGITFKLFYI